MCALLPILPKIDMQANKKMCRYRYVYILSAKIGETAELTILVYILHGYIQCHLFSVFSYDSANSTDAL